MDQYPYDLGRYGRAADTASETAQRWFDRGLNWSYGFNHKEAIACFQKAAQADPECALAHWGHAYAAGPNYNMPWELFDDKQAAAYIDIPPSALKKARCEGRFDLPYLKIGRRVKYRRADLDAFLDRCVIRPGEAAGK